MAKHGESRRALFEARERAALAALPAHPWEWGEWVERGFLTAGVLEGGLRGDSPLALGRGLTDGMVPPPARG